MTDKHTLEFRIPDMDEKNLGEHIYYACLRNHLKIPYKKYELSVCRVIEIPLISYTRLLKYQEHVGVEGIHYEVRYSYKGHIKDKVITRNRFIKAYNKWIKKCWINEWEKGLKQ